MEIGVTKELLQNSGTLHEKANLERVSHTYSAMHLDRFLYSQSGGTTGAGLGHGYRTASTIGVGINLLLRMNDRGAGDFQLTVEFCRAVLQALKLANDAAKLFAFFEVVHRALENFVC